MKLRTLLIVALVPSLTLVAGCATSSRFEWGNYEGALYAYAKKPDKREVYRNALQDAIERGRKTDRVAPGLLAELGYVDLEDGDLKDAIPLFQEEMRRFPESRAFLTPVIARAKTSGGGAGSSGNR